MTQWNPLTASLLGPAILPFDGAIDAFALAFDRQESIFLVVRTVATLSNSSGVRNAKLVPLTLHAF